MINSSLVTRHSLLKLIHREILKELLLSFILSLIFLNFILMMEKVLKLSMMLSGIGASISDMARITAYLQLQLMPLTIPMSLLLSTLVTYGRLNTDNELVILRTSGMTFKAISKPVFMLGTACFIAGLIVSFYAGPIASLNMRTLISNIIMQRTPSAIEPGVFNTSFKDIVILVREKTSSEDMKGVFIYDNRNKKEPKALYAKEGRISADRENNISLYMKDGYIHIAQPKGSTEIFFKAYNLTMNLAVQSPSQKKIEFTPVQLLRFADENKGRPESIPFLIEFHRRLALPVLSLIVMLLGPPLSLIAGKTGRLGGLTVGLGVFMLFHIMMMYGDNIAGSGAVPPYAGMWAPVVIIGVVSIWVFRRVSRR